ncbi:hypothetical protein N0V95_009176 [Ascochyta clinopodiicola]|nr:hypothetical protein N0V95_009176 [Ascochyta clinopodiicola]
MPHSDHSPSPPASSFANLPPFPDNVPTAPLLRISLTKLLNHDKEEQERCWHASQELGFFYLDLRGDNSGESLLTDADQLFQLMTTFYDLPVQDKVSLVEGGREEQEEAVTAKEWILRRALGRREAGGWDKSGGTEEGSMRRGGMRV